MPVSVQGLPLRFRPWLTMLRAVGAYDRRNLAGKRTCPDYPDQHDLAVANPLPNSQNLRNK